MNIENESDEHKKELEYLQKEDISLLRTQFETVVLAQEKHYLRLLKDIIPFLEEAKETIDKLSKIQRPISETLEHLIDAIKEETKEQEKPIKE